MSQKKVKTGTRFLLSGSKVVRLKPKKNGALISAFHSGTAKKLVDAEPFRMYNLTFSHPRTAEPHIREQQLVERLNAFALAAL